MQKRKERCDGKATREAIIEAAAEEFAAKGFELASMREICRKAEVNSALACRYFESKEGLYRTVARRLFGDLGSPMANLTDSVKDDATWTAAVEKWVGAFLFMTLPTKREQELCSGLFKQEVTNPTKFYSEFSTDFGKPVYDSLRGLIAMKVSDETDVELITSSVWAQITVYSLADSKWHKSFRPAGADTESWRKKVAEFICRNLAELTRGKGSSFGK